MKTMNNALYFSYELLESLSFELYEQRLLCHAKNRKLKMDTES